MYNQPLILAIDTSCDDTSVAVLKGRRVLSSVVSSQVEIHAQWGGVVPDIARREHEKNLPLVYEEALKKAKLKIQDIEYIAATYGPGLAIDLEVGLDFGKKLAIKYSKPFIPVNHMEGHMLSGLMGSGPGLTQSLEKSLDEEPLGLGGSVPALTLLISGKHTELVLVHSFGEYEKLGQTLDDAAGEAFDKVARMLNLGYPGGPIVTEFAKKGQKGEIVFPVPMKNSEDLNFSYSGLKTAALYKAKELREEGRKEKDWVYDFCRGFLDAVIDSLKIKVESAIEQHPDVKTLFVGGGVFNSEEILRAMGKVARSFGLKYIFPEKEYRGDNAAMIGVVGYFKVLNNEYLEEREDIEKIDRDPRVSI